MNSVMRNRILLMVALLATAGIMAAMAYTRAEVRNPASAAIVRTDVALLALSCNDGIGNKDGTCSLNTDGRLHLNFAKGKDGEYGFQPGSKYTFENLVKVTNNSEDTVEVSTAASITSGSTIIPYTVTAGSTTMLPGAGTIKLAPGETTSLTFVADVPDNWAAANSKMFNSASDRYTSSGVFTVHAVAVAP